MVAKENFTPLLTVALVITLAILVTFQIYILREPDRIAGVEAHDSSVAVSAGQALFKKNCTLCHGDNGEGTEGRPSLNDKPFLTNTSNDTLYSIISSGVPNTEMPAWNQAFGGPLTNEDVTNLVAFLRAWEPTAPDRKATPQPGVPSQGKTIYNSVCAACHGPNGAGIKDSTAPALNDPAKLLQFDDTWYRDTISKGRPANGMPTWGTVLSPKQITDLLAYLDTWRAAAATGKAATPGTVTATATAAATP
ncbi:MAG TPA: c-type cytochrome [Aggregatilineales bacterium]|nr:c-type cytochrome [Aggregatilineales bacterium]